MSLTDLTTDANKVRIFIKDSHISMLRLVSVSGKVVENDKEAPFSETVIGRFDSRDGFAQLFTYDNLYEADKLFHDAVNTTSERGWNLVYTGDVNYG